ANRPFPTFRNSGNVSLSLAETNRSSRPSLSMSRASAPIELTARPSLLNATPASSATSSNLPSPRLRNRKFGAVSLLTQTSSRPSRLLRGRHLFTRPVSAIAQQSGPVHSCDKDVLPTVVVVVAHRHARRETVAADPGGQRHVRERAIPVIAIEPVVIGRIGL